jgi:hypothetical protein
MRHHLHHLRDRMRRRHERSQQLWQLRGGVWDWRDVRERPVRKLRGPQRHVPWHVRLRLHEHDDGREQLWRVRQRLPGECDLRGWGVRMRNWTNQLRTGPRLSRSDEGSRCVRHLHDDLLYGVLLQQRHVLVPCRDAYRLWRGVRQHHDRSEQLRHVRQCLSLRRCLHELGVRVPFEHAKQVRHFVCEYNHGPEQLRHVWQQLRLVGNLRERRLHLRCTEQDVQRSVCQHVHRSESLRQLLHAMWRGRNLLGRHVHVPGAGHCLQYRQRTGVHEHDE